MHGAPTEITNDDGNGGGSGSGVINDTNVQIMMELITLETNGGVGNDDNEEIVDEMDKANDEYGGIIILLTEGTTTKVSSGQSKLIPCKWLRRGWMELAMVLYY